MSRKIRFLLIATVISSALIIFLSLPVRLPFVGNAVFCSDAQAVMAPEPGTLAVLGLAGGFSLLRRFLKTAGKSNRKDIR